MLVDLGRNDLGRVCEFGTVEVETFMAVETYSHVMHIVSRVAGRLRPDVGPMDALRSILPAGTLSGAPKVRAMQIIDELEPVKRGGYGGAVGYLSYTGDLDTCIHIRTVVMQDGVAHMQAGGGTVADARPDYEYEESRNKARAVARAIELATRQRGVAVSLKVLVIDNYDSFTYNLVQYLGELGRRARGRAQRRRDHATSCWRAGRTASSSRPARARRTRRASRSRSCAASRRPACRRSASASATSRSRRRSAARVVRHVPVHGKTTDDRARRARAVRRAAAPLHGRPLPLARRRPRRCRTRSIVTATGGGVVMGIRHRELPA